MAETLLIYKSALDELESLVHEIESHEVPLDELVQKVTRANELIVFCQESLRSTSEEVNEVLKMKRKER